MHAAIKWETLAGPGDFPHKTPTGQSVCSFSAETPSPSNVADQDTFSFLPELAACAAASTSPTYFLKSLQPTLERTLPNLDQERGLQVLPGARPGGRGEDEAPPCDRSWRLPQRPT